MLALILTLPCALWAVCPDGDLHEDCQIDWRDLDIIAQYWLEPAGSPGDIFGDDGVNLADFAKVAGNWGLKGEVSSLYVKISPPAAVGLGAQWRIDGGSWRNSEETVIDLPIGSHTVEFSEIDTWMPPADQNVVLVEDMLTGINEFYRHPLVINELMASNSKTKKDPQGQYDDWIEIYNRADHAIDIAGMHLTDAMSNPDKWQVPDDIPGLTTIAPGGFLLVWADNDAEDNGTIQSGLHANFELGAEGDKIGLFDSNTAILIDSVSYPDQDPDISYGRFPDGNDIWRFFGAPTPAGTNTGAYPGEVSDTKFSHNRGFYDAPFSVTIATDTEDAEIYYTTDGSSPAGNQPMSMPRLISSSTMLFANPPIRPASRPIGDTPAAATTKWTRE